MSITQFITFNWDDQNMHPNSDKKKKLKRHASFSVKEKLDNLLTESKCYWRKNVIFDYLMWSPGRREKLREHEE